MFKLNNFNIGLLSGIVLGVLFAPRKGSATRKKVIESTKNCKTKVDKIINKRSSDFDEIRKALQDETNEVTKDLRLQILDLLEETESQIQAMDPEKNSFLGI